MSDQDNFYVRYYVGHRGKFGHEFLEFEFRSTGRLRYANNSNYKNDTMIRKEAWVFMCISAWFSAAHTCESNQQTLYWLFILFLYIKFTISFQVHCGRRIEIVWCSILFFSRVW